MNNSKKKFEVIKPGVRLDEQTTDENGALRARTGVRAGVRTGTVKPSGVGCGGPDQCLAIRYDRQ